MSGLTGVYLDILSPQFFVEKEVGVVWINWSISGYTFSSIFRRKEVGVFWNYHLQVVPFWIHSSLFFSKRSEFLEYTSFLCFYLSSYFLVENKVWATFPLISVGRSIKGRLKSSVDMSRVPILFSDEVRWFLSCR